MNINQVIHERWAADATLNGLLPVANFSTGRFMGVNPTFPYATLTRPGDVPVIRDNDGSTVERALLRITVYHARDNYDEGVAIADAVKAAFDRTNFDLSGGDKVLVMQRSGYMELEDQDGAGDWSFVVDFDSLTHLAAGV